MKPIALGEVLNLYDYEKVRQARRQAIIALKADRRVGVGRYLSFVFENRETVWFQIQEMIRAERIVDEGKIAEELAVYNTLLPQPGELAATMFIEIGDAALIKPVLDALLGIDTGGHVRLEVGPHVIAADFESGHSDQDRGKLSAVHFVRFALPPAARRAFADAEVALVVDHPGDPGRTVLTPAVRRSLATDLA
jgi:Protein of unknown function (DUF3501)